MKKTMTISTLVFAVMALSACGALTQDDTVDKASATPQDITTKSNEDGTFSGTIKGLMGMGKAQKCTWSENGEIKGVVYTDGNKSRSDVEGIVMGDDKQGDMAIIDDGVWIYTWDLISKQGMKMESEVKNKYVDVESDDMNVNLEEKIYEYKCKNWKVDTGMFVPPTDVTFQDMNAMLENMKQVTGDMQGTCDFAPTDKKEECLEQMQKMQVDMQNIPQ